MLVFPKSKFDQFRPVKGQRWGQAFYDFMELHKVTDPASKELCDMIYNAKDGLARSYVIANLDFNN